MAEESISRKWVCVFHTRNPGEVVEADLVLKGAQVPFQRRTVLDPEKGSPEERFYVDAGREEEARRILSRWLDAHPLSIQPPPSAAKLLGSVESDHSPESLRPPDLMTLIMLPGTFIVCFLFWNKMAGLTAPISLALSLPIPTLLYFLIRYAQRGD